LQISFPLSEQGLNVVRVCPLYVNDVVCNWLSVATGGVCPRSGTIDDEPQPIL